MKNNQQSVPEQNANMQRDILTSTNEAQDVELTDPSHRDDSRFKALIKISPVDVVVCTREQFLQHLFGTDLRSVVVTDDPNDFHLSSLGRADDQWKYFSPVGILRDHKNWPHGNRLGVVDLFAHGMLKYAAFEVSSDYMPEQFVLEVETHGYPTAAVISVGESIVHLLCRVDAESIEHYRDRCELILRVAHDPSGTERCAKQIAYCSMPSLENGNLLYLNPDEKWRFPVPTKDFE